MKGINILAEKIASWREGEAQYITFVITEDCQLKCRYCYVCGKNSLEKMDFETAKQAVDFVLLNRQLYGMPFVVWSFIGGEPLLEIELMDKVCDYIKIRLTELDHPWLDKYRFNMSSNGLLYNDERVQKFIRKNAQHLSIGISVDGTKQKHDLQRVFPNGSGSYDVIAKNIPLWHEQFPGTPTKATIGHVDLPLVKDSVLHLWQIGITEVAMNCIFEDVWQDCDDEVWEKQLIKLADAIIEQHLYKEHKISLFARNIGFVLDAQYENKNFCGAGKMLAVDTKGNFYPCLRFIKYSLGNKDGWKIGSIAEGIDTNKLRPFLALNRTSQSNSECIHCEVASGCAWCLGYNYDAADTNTIYQRATFLCKMHKARVRANNYLWNKLDRILPPPENDARIQRLAHRKGLQSIILIADDSAPSFCYYDNAGINPDKSRTMTLETLRKVVYYALTHNLSLNVLAGSKPLSDEFMKELSQSNHIFLQDVFILRLTLAELPQLPQWLAKHSLDHDRISLVITDLPQAIETDFETYRGVLNQIADWLPEREEQKPLELSFLTDRLILTNPNHCEAGVKHITIVPDGGFYLCPGFYYDGETEFTNIDEVLRTHTLPIKNRQLLQLDHAPICEKCDSYHCKRCIYLNKKMTGEVNTPSKQQCVFSHLERNASRSLIEPLFLQDEVDIAEIDYLDPFEKHFCQKTPMDEC